MTTSVTPQTTPYRFDDRHIGVLEPNQAVGDEAADVGGNERTRLAHQQRVGLAEGDDRLATGARRGWCCGGRGRWCGGG